MRFKTQCNLATFKLNLEINERGKAAGNQLGSEIAILYSKKIRQRISDVENNLIYVYYYPLLRLSLLFETFTFTVFDNIFFSFCQNDFFTTSTFNYKQYLQFVIRVNALYIPMFPKQQIIYTAVGKQTPR